MKYILANAVIRVPLHILGLILARYISVDWLGAEDSTIVRMTVAGLIAMGVYLFCNWLFKTFKIEERFLSDTAEKRKGKFCRVQIHYRDGTTTHRTFINEEAVHNFHMKDFDGEKKINFIDFLTIDGKPTR